MALQEQGKTGSLPWIFLTTDQPTVKMGYMAEKKRGKLHQLKILDMSFPTL